MVQWFDGSMVSQRIAKPKVLKVTKKRPSHHSMTSNWSY